jgi:copper chaperone CopZ
MRTTILAVVSGILGSICCIGIPSLSVFSAYLVKLEFLRPLFLLLAFGFLSYGYFKLFVKSKICCEKDKLKLMFNRIFLILATIFVVYITIIDYKPLNAQTKSVKVQQENGYPISVGGISCADCIEHIKNALMKLEEVKDVHYDAKKDVFYISIKEGFKFDENKIKLAIENIGYKYKGLVK